LLYEIRVKLKLAKEEHFTWARHETLWIETTQSFGSTSHAMGQF
jgi:hypothetical protein